MMFSSTLCQITSDHDFQSDIAAGVSHANPTRSGLLISSKVLPLAGFSPQEILRPSQEEGFVSCGDLPVNDT
jgi:hypothetical protein